MKGHSREQISGQAVLVKDNHSLRRHSPSVCACRDSALPANPGGREDFLEPTAGVLRGFQLRNRSGRLCVGSRKLVAVRTAAHLLRYSDSTNERSSPGAGAPTTVPGKRCSASERECCAASSSEGCTGSAAARHAALAPGRPVECFPSFKPSRRSPPSSPF